MNKTDLVEAVALETELSKAAAARAVDAILGTITSALQKDDTVSLIGFGNFTTKARVARTGRNPRTGEQIQIPAAKLPVFKPGKALKDAVAESA